MKPNSLLLSRPGENVSLGGPVSLRRLRGMLEMLNIISVNQAGIKTTAGLLPCELSRRPGTKHPSPSAASLVARGSRLAVPQSDG